MAELAPGGAATMHTIKRHREILMVGSKIYYRLMYKILFNTMVNCIKTV